MTRGQAMKILMDDGWNYDGADSIVDALEIDEMLNDATEESLLATSEDYKDR